MVLMWRSEEKAVSAGWSWHGGERHTGAVVVVVVLGVMVVGVLVAILASTRTIIVCPAIHPLTPPWLCAPPAPAPPALHQHQHFLLHQHASPQQLSNQLPCTATPPSLFTQPWVVTVVLSEPERGKAGVSPGGPVYARKGQGSNPTALRHLGGLSQACCFPRVWARPAGHPALTSALRQHQHNHHHYQHQHQQTPPATHSTQW